MFPLFAAGFGLMVYVGVLVHDVLPFAAVAIVFAIMFSAEKIVEALRK